MLAGGASNLFGRYRECRVLDRLLVGGGFDRGSVLVLRGESGVGKTALLEYVLERSYGWRAAWATGTESEMELAFAGLHQLCLPFLDRLERLPVPQQDALRVAFGLTRGSTPDRFLVGLAVLSLLGDAADERPLLCLIDDVQWLDDASAQCIGFVARRLLAEPVVMVFAVRVPSVEGPLSELPVLEVEGLGDHDAAMLLDSVSQGPLDAQVRDRIVAETRGNPLALVELPRGLTPTQLAGGFGLPQGRPLAPRVEQRFLERTRLLSAETQRLLLLAAAEPVGDVNVLWRAAERLGIDRNTALREDTESLVEFGGRVRFRHPLVRSAVYRAAAPGDRRAIHAALADATDPVSDPDRLAWHHAQATSGSDETVASELEVSAARARGRGGIAAAAAFLERSAELTADPARRGERAMAAAQAAFDAGAPQAASELLATAKMCPLDEHQQATLDRLRARVEYARTRGRGGAATLLASAKRLEPIDLQLARETYLEALWAAVRAGRFGNPGELTKVAQAAGAAPASIGPQRAIDLLLDGLVARATNGYAAAVPLLTEAVAALRREGLAGYDIGWCWLACQTAMDLWDDEACAELSGSLADVARDTGALVALPFALNYVAAHRLFAGEFAAAAQLIDEADAISHATGNARVADFSVLLAAWRGQQNRVAQLRETSIQDATQRGDGLAVAAVEWAVAVLNNGLGAYGEALASAQRASDHDALGFGVWVLPELVEAAARSGEPEIAREALEQLTMRTSLSGTQWAAGIEARSRALISDDDDAERFYTEAIERLGRCRITVHLSRARLIYGEWLRRQNRRSDAREQLRAAYELFEAMGADAFAERTRRELLATGETVRQRAASARDALTDQEAVIARLAGEGQTNPEIAAQLFLSPRTVEWHLRKVFSKLDVSSRKQLRAALGHDQGRSGSRTRQFGRRPVADQHP